MQPGSGISMKKLNLIAQTKRVVLSLLWTNQFSNVRYKVKLTKNEIVDTVKLQVTQIRIVTWHTAMSYSLGKLIDVLSAPKSYVERERKFVGEKPSRFTERHFQDNIPTKTGATVLLPGANESFRHSE